MQDPFPSTTARRAATPIIGLLLACALAGCSATPAPRPSQPAASATPSAVPAADGIRTLDPAALQWSWFDTHASFEPVDVSKPDTDGRSYTVGDPVYADADGDGLEDLAVSIAQKDGNGYREQWHIWLAHADGTAEQVPIPIAWTLRCGDATESVTPTEGGFTVHEFLREPVVDDHVACSDKGTFEVTRGVGVLQDGEALYPVDLADPRGYGGVCPTQQRTETGVTKVWGSVGPDQRAALSIDGENMYLILTHPHTLTQGADPKRLAAVWPRGGNSEDRICVWIDPVRSERSGE